MAQGRVGDSGDALGWLAGGVRFRLIERRASTWRSAPSSGAGPRSGPSTATWSIAHAPRRSRRDRGRRGGRSRTSIRGSRAVARLARRRRRDRALDRPGSSAASINPATRFLPWPELTSPRWPRRVANGDLGPGAQTTGAHEHYGTDEIGVLSETFNAMLVKIHGGLAQLQRHARELTTRCPRSLRGAGSVSAASSRWRRPPRSPAARSRVRRRDGRRPGPRAPGPHGRVDRAGLPGGRPRRRRERRRPPARPPRPRCRPAWSPRGRRRRGQRHRGDPSARRVLFPVDAAIRGLHDAPTRSAASSPRSPRSPSRPTCWRSTPRSRPPAPASRARASPSSPKRSASSRRSPRPRPRRSPASSARSSTRPSRSSASSPRAPAAPKRASPPSSRPVRPSSRSAPSSSRCPAGSATSSSPSATSLPNPAAPRRDINDVARVAELSSASVEEVVSRDRADQRLRSGDRRVRAVAVEHGP